MKIIYPTEEKGQLFIPGINLLLYIGCVGVVLFFQKSTNMEAAYGLAITLCMISTSILFANFLVRHRTYPIWIYLYLIVYITIESSFLIANLEKFPHGGYVTLLVGGGLFWVMYVWFRSRKIKNRYIEFVKLQSYLPMIKDLMKDETVPIYSTHLVYMTSATNAKEIEHKIMYSILNMKPKRANVYWFVHVEILDDPYSCEYYVDQIVPNEIFRVEFRLGFRVEQRITLMLKQVIQDMVAENEVNVLSRFPSLAKNNIPGDYRVIVMEKFLSRDNELSLLERIIMRFYFWFKEISLSEERGFGLDTSSVTVEKFPLMVSPVSKLNLKRVTHSIHPHVNH